MCNGTLKTYTDNIEIMCSSFDILVKKNNIKRIDILKIDAKGAELLILRCGIKSAIPLVKKILI